MGYGIDDDDDDDDDDELNYQSLRVCKGEMKLEIKQVHCYQPLAPQFFIM